MGELRMRVLMEPRHGARYTEILALARATEDAGFDAFFRSDHLMGVDPDDPDYLPTECWSTLGGIARETSRIRLGALVGAFALLAAIAGGTSIAAVKIRGAQQTAQESLASMQEEKRQRDLADKAKTEEELRRKAEEQKRADAEKQRTAAELAGADARKAQVTAENKATEIKQQSEKDLAAENQRLIAEKGRAERAQADAEHNLKLAKEADAKLQAKIDEQKRVIDSQNEELKRKHVITNLGQ